MSEPTSDELLQAADIIEDLSRHRNHMYPETFAWTPNELRDLARELLDLERKRRRKRDKMFQLASDIELYQRGHQWSAHQVAQKLIDDGWDKLDADE